MVETLGRARRDSVRRGKSKYTKWGGEGACHRSLELGADAAFASCLQVWLWVGTPFPTKDPWVEEPPWNLPWPGDGTTTSSAPTATGDWTATRGASPAFAAATGQAFAAPVPGPLRRRWQMLEILPNPLLGKATQIPSRTRAIAALPTRRSRVDWDGDEGEDTDDPEILPVDANWYFFLFFCESPLTRTPSRNELPSSPLLPFLTYASHSISAISDSHRQTTVYIWLGP